MNVFSTVTKPPSKTKAFFQKYFIDAFTGMALGLFVTLIAGLIISQIGNWLQLPALAAVGKLASVLMGAGIGIGIAYYLKAPTLVVLSCLVAGMLGAHSEALMAGTLFIPQATGPAAFIALPGNPIGAYLAAVFAYRAGTWIAGKTKLDILLIPLVVCVVALVVCALLNPPVVAAVNSIGFGIQAATELQPLLMGIVIAVVVGILLTLPTSSAAICISIGLGGLAGGAAVVGCAAHMIGFAVASYKDNGISGVISQGLGTSMLQIPNVFKKPLILLPAVIASAIVGPIATVGFQLACTATGAGMGTAGLVGVFGVIEASQEIMSSTQLWTAIILLMFVLPAIIAWSVAHMMRRLGWIVAGDMKLP
ncbi:phosphotransferase system, EIIC [Glaciecola punicea ACAM 611]|uniref:Phosphotransferase system, EIIC n=1 Tax=Glaciecola punicea ACAM 611 TaxID=1121923 RepID=H5TCQ8_9ALTE|nr:PTS sugar transporter subunit IIC [Glaciecola punicea]OFA31988.1 toxin regulator PfoR [Glaciecola punicea]GAB56085.1 phosphotransferase system, EIIC [Glaciecola punicea ACAM 611]